MHKYKLKDMKTKPRITQKSVKTLISIVVHCKFQDGRI